MDVLIETAVDRHLTAEEVGRYCRTARHSVSDFCDLFARRVVQRYLAGELPWSDADGAMNAIFTIMTQHCGPVLPDYGWMVYLAFDEGEYRPPGGDAVTKPLLAKIGVRPSRDSD